MDRSYVGQFTCYCDKRLTQLLEEERVYSGSQCGGTVHHGEEGMRGQAREPEEAGRVTSCAQLPFSFLFSPGPEAGSVGGPLTTANDTPKYLSSR